MKERAADCFSKGERLVRFINFRTLIRGTERAKTIYVLPMLLDHRQTERQDLDELLELLGLTERAASSSERIVRRSTAASCNWKSIDQ